VDAVTIKTQTISRYCLRLSAALGVLSAFPVQAEEEVFFSSLPVVASVSRLPQRVADAPTSVTVIDREMIRSMPVRDLNDVFRLVPAFRRIRTPPRRVG